MTPCFKLFFPFMVLDSQFQILSSSSECPMMKKDLLGGASLIDIENIETWEDCGKSKFALFTL